MIHSQNTKVVRLYPRSVATNATASVTCDTLGFSHALVIVNGGVASSNMTTLTLSDGEASNSFTAISTFTGGTATSTSVGFVIPTADTTNGVSVEMSVDLKKRGRYLKLSCENTSVAHVIGAEIILSRAAIAPDDTTERNVNVYVAG